MTRGVRLSQAAFEALLERYRDAEPGRRYPEIRTDFERLARRAPSELVEKGLLAALVAKDTPPVAAMITRLFRSADERLRLTLVARLAECAGVAPREGLRGPDVHRLAQRAARQRGDMVDQICPLLVDHPALAASLDGIALTHAVATMAKEFQKSRTRMRRSAAAKPGRRSSR